MYLQYVNVAVWLDSISLCASLLQDCNLGTLGMQCQMASINLSKHRSRCPSQDTWTWQCGFIVLDDTILTENSWLSSLQHSDHK